MASSFHGQVGSSDCDDAVIVGRSIIPWMLILVINTYDDSTSLVLFQVLLYIVTRT